ncbi:MAG TPA: nicotinamide riboside transporter PnuC [Flavobacteriales bacterium]|nr:nicotinamide riboside transporter PnuC [Flavobacteriales bacterium]
MTEAGWVALEWSSAVLGACYTFLAAFEKRIGWIFAIVSSVMFVVYYLHRNYTGQAVLNVYYVIMGIYGWFSWGRDTTSIPVTRKPLAFHAMMLAAVVAATAGGAWLFERYGWSESPRMDAWVGVFSAVATWMMARKLIENWAYWCLVDGVAITMFLTADPPMRAYALLFATYVVLSVVGFWRWRRTMRAS